MKNSKSDYFEKLKDPRWQKKRLEILKRDDWTCKACGSKEETLHVHHRKYEFGKDPWEADSSSLITVCEKCHKHVTSSVKYLKRIIEISSPDDVTSLALCVEGLKDLDDSLDHWIYYIRWSVRQNKVKEWWDETIRVMQEEPDKLGDLCAADYRVING